jgi:uncharacterized protein (DUF1697 family)
MSRYVALLRAINVGGHNVKMDELRRQFERLGFSNVETFIASGNVLFDTKSSSPAVIEQKIEAGLRKALGYEVATMVRSGEEMARIAKHQPFPRARVDSAVTFNVGFLSAPLDAAAKKTLLALQTDHDDLHTRDREVFWLCQTRMSESALFKISFEKKLGCRMTVRNLTTVTKLAEKFTS